MTSAGMKANGNSLPADTVDDSYSLQKQSNEWTKSTPLTAIAITPSSLRYGCLGVSPAWLQWLNGPRAFLAFLCWFTFVQSFAVNGLTNVNTTTLERRYQLSSTQVGIISGIYDIVAGVFVLPLSYYGGRGHKPRYLAVAALFIVGGCVVMTLPHATVGPYEYTADSKGTLDGLCDGANSTSECSKLTGDVTAIQLRSYFYVFLLGMGLIGLGGITLYTLGTVFIDENVSTDRGTFFMGVFFGFTSLGSAAGFLVGSQFLAIYVDTPSSPPTAISQEDPQWVGAWWMGYVLNILLASFLAFFLSGYPRELPSAQDARETRVSEAHHQGGAQGSADRRAAADPLFGTRFRDVPMATALLLRIPSFVCITLAGITDGLVKSGIAQFLAKFIQNQFNQTASWSAMLAGFIIIPGAAGGCFFGGWLPKRLQLKVSGLLVLCVISSVVVAALSAALWMRCDVEILAGVTKLYRTEALSSAISLTSSCNAHCSCGTSAYTPVCGSDGLQYFSACYGGCSSFVTDTHTQQSALFNCSCMAAGNKGQPGEARLGKCSISCPLLYVFIFVMFLSIFATFVTLTPYTSMSLRIVPESQRAYAIGFQAVFIRLVGLAPGPVLFGAIIDAACVVWQDKCGDTGSCWVYRGEEMSRNLFVAIFCLKLVSAFLYYLAYKFYRPPPMRVCSDPLQVGSLLPLTPTASEDPALS